MANVVANVMVGVATLFYHTTPNTASASVLTEIGYTEDGVTIEYTPTIADIEVEEQTFPISRVLTKEEVVVTANCAENLAANLLQALAGGLGTPIVLGGGAIKDFALRIYGSSPGGLHRTIYVPYAHVIGAVAMSYRKGEKTIIPISFSAYKGQTGVDAVTITDA